MVLPVRIERAAAGDEILRRCRFAAGCARGRFALTMSLLLLTAATVAAPGLPAVTAGTHLVPTSQQLAVILTRHVARSAPSAHSTALGLVAKRRPITAERTVLPVIGRAKGPGGALWLHVLLPGRPNGHTGWILERGTTESTTAWAIVVHTSTRRATVYDHGRPLRTFEVVVGKPSTPTPLGRFFVEEDVLLAPNAPGAPFALALSARSNVLREFDGGPGQIALHGLENLGGLPGTAVSHGCVRIDATTLRWLVSNIGPGAPVTIAS